MGCDALCKETICYSTIICALLSVPTGELRFRHTKCEPQVIYLMTPNEDKLGRACLKLTWSECMRCTVMHLCCVELWGSGKLPHNGDDRFPPMLVLTVLSFRVCVLKKYHEFWHWNQRIIFWWEPNQFTMASFPLSGPDWSAPGRFTLVRALQRERFHERPRWMQDVHRWYSCAS